jgi:hydroxymethylpyrimidine pyrophosphatase-like HAD family hydrolase
MTKTIFCDIDGTLVRHLGAGLTGQLNHHLDDETFLLSGSVKKLNEWQAKGYTIILTTGRRESQRKQTEAQLSRLGLIWDQLIMGLPNGPRIVINDLKTGVDPDLDQDYVKTAQSICLVRNKGIGGVEL